MSHMLAGACIGYDSHSPIVSVERLIVLLPCVCHVATDSYGIDTANLVAAFGKKEKKNSKISRCRNTRRVCMFITAADYVMQSSESDIKSHCGLDLVSCF